MRDLPAPTSDFRLLLQNSSLMLFHSLGCKLGLHSIHFRLQQIEVFQKNADGPKEDKENKAKKSKRIDEEWIEPILHRNLAPLWSVAHSCDCCLYWLIAWSHFDLNNHSILQWMWHTIAGKENATISQERPNHNNNKTAAAAATEKRSMRVWIQGGYAWTNI